MIEECQNKLNGAYRGQVLKHLSSGFCKIWIPGVYPESWKQLPDKLPSAEQASSLFSGACNGNGVFTYPNISSTVWCMFQNGDQNLPLYFASTLGNAVSSYTLTNDENITELKLIATHYIHSDNSHVWIQLQGLIKILTNDLKSSIILIDKDGNIKISSDTQIDAVSPTVNVNGQILVNISSDTLINEIAPTITITGKSKVNIISESQIDIISPVVNITGDTNINGNLTITGITTSNNFLSSATGFTFDTHFHMAGEIPTTSPIG